VDAYNHNETARRVPLTQPPPQVRPRNRDPRGRGHHPVSMLLLTLRRIAAHPSWVTCLGESSRSDFVLRSNCGRQSSLASG
jgi:hypothetical protein